MFQILVSFYVKTATPSPEKIYPLFPCNSPLKLEILSSSPFLKTWLEAHPPTPRPSREGGQHTVNAEVKSSKMVWTCGKKWQMDKQMHSLRNRWFQGQSKTSKNMECSSGRRLLKHRTLMQIMYMIDLCGRRH